MRTSPREFGSCSEAIAAEYLERRGYRIVDRNYRVARGEIDLIAYDGPTLVFVEVKARRGNRFGEPHWAVHRQKRARLLRLANYYLFRKRIKNQACRFDLVLIEGKGSEAMNIELLQDAFDGKEGSY